MSRPYFTLLSRPSQPPAPWIIEFGAFDKDDVEFERDDMRQGHDPIRATNLKIIRTPDAKSATIYAAIRKLNQMVPA